MTGRFHAKAQALVLRPTQSGDTARAMSQTDIENLRAGFDAYNDGDFEGMLELWAEDVELVRLGGGKPVRGKEAIRSWLVPEAIDQWGEPSSFATTGSACWRPATGRPTGGGAAWRFTTGSSSSSPCELARFARVENFADEQEALEAAGLSA